MGVRVNNKLREFKKHIETVIFGNASSIAKKLASQIEQVVKDRIVRGEGQPPYSTNPQWFSTTRPKGAQAKFAAFLASQGISKRRARKMKFIFMPKGYAQWRGIFRSEGTKTKPVNFQLTGQLYNNIRGRFSVNKKRKEVRAWLGFRRQQRTYGRLTNVELAHILNERGTFPQFEVLEEEADTILDNALEAMVKDL